MTFYHIINDLEVGMPYLHAIHDTFSAYRAVAMIFYGVGQPASVASRLPRSRLFSSR